MSTNLYGIILWQMETYFVNEKFTQSTGHGYQEVINGTSAEVVGHMPNTYFPINLFNIHVKLCM